MKSITLLYDSKGFQAIENPGRHFSVEEFRQECDRMELTGRTDIALRVILLTTQCLIIPSAADAKEFYHFHFSADGQPDSAELGDRLQKIVYAVPEGLLPDLQSILPQTHLYADCALVGRQTLSRSLSVPRPGGEDCFFIYLTQGNAVADGPSPYNGESLFIFVANQGKMAFANSFRVHSPEEILYFTLAVKEHFARCKGCTVCTTCRNDEALSALLAPHFEDTDTVTLAESHAEPFLKLFSETIV